MALPTGNPLHPNWVSSDAPPGPRHVAPLHLVTPDGDADGAWARLVERVRAQPRWRILEERPDRLHVECRTRLLRFRDDLVLERRGRLVAVYSASRLGHSDLGTNRRRVERLRRDLGR